MGMMYERGSGNNEPDTTSWNREIGPFYSPTGLSTRLQITEEALQQQTGEGKLLALRTEEGQIVYPTRQFFVNEDGAFMVNPAVPIALQFLMEHEADFADLRHVVIEETRTPLISEWTIAAALLQKDDKGRTLLDDLHQHLQEREDESWNRLLTLNGLASGLRKFLDQDDDSNS